MGKTGSKEIRQPTTGETPPRTWGRRLQPVKRRITLRNTPTHVGKTNRQNPWCRLHRKHPHARGEDEGVDFDLELTGETPPRTWGRLMRPPCAIVDSRNTPTHVGKTLRLLRGDKGSRKHPHARGEDWRGAGGVVRMPGNTPTHVGKTGKDRENARTHRKHPHARGEDRSSSIWSAVHCRNTPTHVGKTRHKSAGRIS